MKRQFVVCAVLIILLGGVGLGVRNPSPVTATHLLTSPYQVYSAHISQSGTGDPTATVYTNTLGSAVVLDRVEEGLYTLTADGAFTVGKTTLPSTIIFQESNDGLFLFTRWYQVDADTIALQPYRLDNQSGMEMQPTHPLFVEIRVYP